MSLGCTVSEHLMSDESARIFGWKASGFLFFGIWYVALLEFIRVLQKYTRLSMEFCLFWDHCPDRRRGLKYGNVSCKLGNILGSPFRWKVRIEVIAVKEVEGFFIGHLSGGRCGLKHDTIVFWVPYIVTFQMKSVNWTPWGTIYSAAIFDHVVEKEKVFWFYRRNGLPFIP